MAPILPERRRVPDSVWVRNASASLRCAPRRGMQCIAAADRIKRVPAGGRSTKPFRVARSAAPVPIVAIRLDPINTQSSSNRLAYRSLVRTALCVSFHRVLCFAWLRGRERHRQLGRRRDLVPQRHRSLAGRQRSRCRHRHDAEPAAVLHARCVGGKQHGAILFHAFVCMCRCGCAGGRERNCHRYERK